MKRTNSLCEKNLLCRYVTCVSKLAKDVDEDICICSTSFQVRGENTHYVLIIWKIIIKSIKSN